MKHRYLVHKRVKKSLYSEDEHKYFWADEQCDEMSVYWKWFPDEYGYKVFIRFFVDGEEYVEGIWHEEEPCSDGHGVDYPAHFEELYYHKSCADGKELPEPIVQRIFNMGRGGELKDKHSCVPILVKKSFIDKWYKLHDDQYAMEEEFRKMTEQVKKGVA